MLFKVYRIGSFFYTESPKAFNETPSFLLQQPKLSSTSIMTSLRERTLLPFKTNWLVVNPAQQRGHLYHLVVYQSSGCSVYLRTKINCDTYIFIFKFELG